MGSTPSLPNSGASTRTESGSRKEENCFSGGGNSDGRDGENPASPTGTESRNCPAHRCRSVNQRFVTVSLFGTLAVLWGFTFLAIAVGLESLEPVLFAAFRYDTAAVLLLGYALVADVAWVPTSARNLRAIVAGGIFLIATHAFLFVGQQTVPSGVAAIMQSHIPIATSLWALALLPEERVSVRDAVGILLGFAGVALIVRPDPANLLGASVVGRLLILLQVGGVALGGVLIQRTRPTLDKIPLTGWSMLVGGVILHAVSSGIGEPFSFPTTVPAGVAVAYSGSSPPPSPTSSISPCSRCAARWKRRWSPTSFRSSPPSLASSSSASRSRR
jgi:drug/metabolite transporter (DMT)-like permease